MPIQLECFVSQIALFHIILMGFFHVHLDLQTNYSFGYGFVNFVSEEGALQAIKTLNGITLRNKRLKVNIFIIMCNELHFRTCD